MTVDDLGILDSIYTNDFYGFPPHYYEYKFPYKGSPEVAEKVIGKLSAAGIEIEKVKRGLDHGVWARFIIVSLLNNEDTDEHYRMGQTLESLRDEDILIVGAGMAVRNLRDFRAIRDTGKTMPYTFSFDEALKGASSAEPEERRAKMLALMERSDARKAHPSLEHILPIHVAAGASGLDVSEQLRTFPELRLSWAQYRFGKFDAA
ncbi:4,5-DOPA dioxygenase extradiol [Lachnellula willkommii]|uniref:4,5-DOPA dioxygenase extradiol n=1 Tax=Lachnellula willkommii TaxID=215461 RepID=A0A559MJ72_9HELO|nr:4,5-DOPA dioxygenase extradiol [Lachnellula willkommii]